MADFIAEFTPSRGDIEGLEDSKKWVVHVDGSSTQHAGGIGVVLQSPEGDKLKHKICLQYQATNNEIEYKALLKGLELAKSVELANFIQILREEIVEVDTLAKEALVTGATDEFDEVQYVPSIDLPDVQQIENEENWMTPIVSYLKDGKLSKGKDEARKLKVRAARYFLMEEVLYKRGFS